MTEMQSEVFDHEVMMVNMNRQGSRELNTQSKASADISEIPQRNETTTRVHMREDGTIKTQNVHETCHKLRYYLDKWMDIATVTRTEDLGTIAITEPMDRNRIQIKDKKNLTQ